MSDLFTTEKRQRSAFGFPFDQLLSHWKMLVVLGAGVLLISPFPHSLYDHFIGPRTTQGVPQGQGDQQSAATPEREQAARPNERGERESRGTELWVLSEKLGEALIIAAILGVVVDESVKKNLVKETLEDVLYAAVGYELPQEVRDHLKYILRLPFVRKPFKITYTFRKISLVSSEGKPAGNCWQVESVAEYGLLNLTHSQLKFDLKSAVERSRSGLPKNALLLMEGAGLHAEADVLAAEAKEEGPYLRVTREIQVRRNAEGPVAITTKRVAHYALEDTIVLDILEPPCLGITVRVDAPPEITVNVTFGTPGAVKPAKDEGLPSWTHDGVHLPGSHFKLTWNAGKGTAGIQAVSA